MDTASTARGSLNAVGSEEPELDRPIVEGLTDVLASRVDPEPSGALSVRRELIDGGWLELYALGMGPEEEVTVASALAAGEALGRHNAEPWILIVTGFLYPLLSELRDASWTALVRAHIDRLAVPVPLLSSATGVHALGGALRARPDEGNFVLDGRVRDIVTFGGPRTAVVGVTLASGEPGLAVVALDADGIAVKSRETVCTGTSVLTITAQEVAIPGTAITTAHVDAAVAAAGARWSLLLDAAAVGVCRAVVDQSVEYAKDREQFGKPIGTFQAVQMMLSDMQVATISSRSVVLAAAADGLSQHGAPAVDDSLLLCSRLHCGKSAKTACELAIQVHGGAGYTWEVGLHRWYRSAMLALHYLTDVAATRRILAQHLRAAVQARDGTG